MRSMLFACLFGGAVSGPRGPDGTTVQCDLPGELQRRNTTSRGQGCCVWTSIHHAALWQNVPAFVEAPKWVQSRNLPGGAYPGAVQQHLPAMAKERGAATPAFLNYEGSDLDMLRLACRTGRMPGTRLVAGTLRSTICRRYPRWRHGSRSMASSLKMNWWRSSKCRASRCAKLWMNFIVKG